MTDLLLVEPAADVPTAGLAHLALLVVRGADARAFLDSQLTRNVPSDAGRASPAGYCSPKGRLLATFVVWADDESVFLVVARDIVGAIAKRLRMYVLRSKATIDDATSSHRLDGFVDRPELATIETWDVREIDGARWIRVPDADGRPRGLRIAPRDVAADGALDAATWRWLDIRAGLATITAATQERFVPQMINLEALDGVDFKKGCYPGQEVVARSQYLGKLKRRTTRATIDRAADVPAAGTDVWSDADAQAIGLVVDAERGPDGTIAALVELPVASFAAIGLRVGSKDGAPLSIESLPYPLPDNEVFVRPKL